MRCFHADSCRLAELNPAARLPTNNENLIVKAVNLLRSDVGIDRGIQITLIKRIPVASGLAGGSSDAAATLAGLNRFWNLGCSAGKLNRLAAELGSDVGFFLNPEPVAVCRGRGERVEPICVASKLWFVIVRPPSGLSTAAVFRRCRPVEHPLCVERILAPLLSGRLGEVGASLHNSLQTTAEELNPQIAELRERFSTQPFSGHRMTGSGTAYFGLCTSRRQAEHIASRLRQTQSGRVYVAGSGP
ncbi:MAG: 4-(cytidine 5'-diphospho)-2-C-methyl-D-erythritol kinase [Planctomycetes bacterium]|nr:4-(cytidine 5'-diphospho)-2-C-methyl-D-erythritol kinase [Planctomycetota bacterium]